MAVHDLPPLPPLSPAHREDQLKLAANGLQALALTLLGGVVIAPLISPAMIAPTWAKAAAFAIAGIFEATAFFLLRYVPHAASSTEHQP